MAAGDTVPVGDPELQEDAAVRRGPKLAVAGIGVAWVTMAALAVTVFRPELAEVKRVAERAAAVAAQPPNLAPFVGPADFAGKRAGPPTAPSPASSPAVPLKWRTYTDPTGFSLKVPDGWSQSYRSSDEVRFTGPRPGLSIVIDWSTSPKPDQYTDWEQQAAYKAQTDPTYQQIGIHRVSYRGYNSADWEFINLYQGRPTHVLDHGFIAVPGALAYAIEISAPADGFNALRAQVWTELLASFSPARLPAPAGSPALSRPPSAEPTSAEPMHPAEPTPSGQPTPAASGGPGYPGVPGAVSNCAQAANASSIGAIIRAAQACAADLTSH